MNTTTIGLDIAAVPVTVRGAESIAWCAYANGLNKHHRPESAAQRDNVHACRTSARGTPHCSTRRPKCRCIESKSRSVCNSS